MRTVTNRYALSGALGVAVLAAALMAACGGDNNAPTTPVEPSGTLTSAQLFEGKLSVGGSAFYSFTTLSEDDASLMLASVMTSSSPGSSSNVALGLAFGSPLGEDCVITTAVVTSASLSAQLVNKLKAGTYCARVYDVGNLKVPVSFAVRIVHT